MGMLQDFLNDNVIDGLTKETVVSDRFKDKDGNILKFKIKAMIESELENARKAATRTGKKGKTEFNQ